MQKEENNEIFDFADEDNNQNVGETPELKLESKVKIDEGEGEEDAHDKEHSIESAEKDESKHNNMFEFKESKEKSEEVFELQKDKVEEPSHKDEETKHDNKEDDNTHNEEVFEFHEEEGKEDHHTKKDIKVELNDTQEKVSQKETFEFSKQNEDDQPFEFKQSEDKSKVEENKEEAKPENKIIPPVETNVEISQNKTIPEKEDEIENVFEFTEEKDEVKEEKNATKVDDKEQALLNNNQGENDIENKVHQEEVFEFTEDNENNKENGASDSKIDNSNEHHMSPHGNQIHGKSIIEQHIDSDKENQPKDSKNTNEEDDVFEFAEEENNNNLESSEATENEKKNETEYKIDTGKKESAKVYDLSENIEIKKVKSENEISIENESSEKNGQDDDSDEFQFAEENQDHPENKIEHNEIKKESRTSSELDEKSKKEDDIPTENETIQNEIKSEIKLTQEMSENKVINKQEEEDDDEFNFVEDDEPNTLETPKNEVLERKPRQSFKAEDDSDAFDFVEEQEENKLELKEVKEETKPKDNDDFDFVEESEDQQEESINNKNKQQITSQFSNATTNKLSYIEGKNKDTISSLISSYKEKYLKSKENVNIINEDRKIGTDCISDFILDIDLKNLPLKNLIENIPNFKSEPEVGIKQLYMKDILTLPKYLDEYTKKEKKGSKFISAMNEVSNSTIKKQYFKYLDLKNIYVNVTQLSSNKTGMEILSPMIKKNSRNNQELNEEIEVAMSEGNIPSDTPRSKKEDTFNLELRKKTSNSGMIEPVNPSDDFEFNEEINEDFEDEKANAKPKIEIDKALYSIVIDPNLVPVKKEEDTKFKKEENKEEPVTTESAYDEDKMLEFLKTFSKNKESSSKIPEVSEEEKNNEELKKIIESLPNYNFMVSKFVEYPDSLFNI